METYQRSQQDSGEYMKERRADWGARSQTTKIIVLRFTEGRGKEDWRSQGNDGGCYVTRREHIRAIKVFLEAKELKGISDFPVNPKEKEKIQSTGKENPNTILGIKFSRRPNGSSGVNIGRPCA